jgi:hypothetical protein
MFGGPEILEEICVIKNKFHNNTKMLLFHCAKICTNCAKAVVGKDARAFTGITVALPNSTSSYCTHHQYTAEVIST